jgi:SAM-dependent methyltransferase
MSVPRRPFTPTPGDPRIFAQLAHDGFGQELFNERQHRSCAYVDAYVLELSIRLIADLGIAPELVLPRSVPELLKIRRFAAEFRGPLAWLLRYLAWARIVVADDGATPEPRYRLAAGLPQAEPERLRDAGLATDPSYAPTYAMLDQAAVAYGKIARGEDTAEHALFQNVAPWVGYFSNANGYYAINNRVAAAAAAARLRDGAHVLEVGVGLGSASEALLDRLGARSRTLASYRATEPVQFFRRRADRALRERLAGVPLQTDPLDLNRPWAEQGVDAGSYDLVWGVNVFHLARRLDAVLGDALRALAPGGVLVVGEGMRPLARTPVAAELPFQLLSGFVDVETDERRPQVGFLTAAQWRAALERVGFADVVVVPDVERLVELSPEFYGAAVCGRRR